MGKILKFGIVLAKLENLERLNIITTKKADAVALLQPDNQIKIDFLYPHSFQVPCQLPRLADSSSSFFVQGLWFESTTASDRNEWLTPKEKVAIGFVC